MGEVPLKQTEIFFMNWGGLPVAGALAAAAPRVGGRVPHGLPLLSPAPPLLARAFPVT